MNAATIAASIGNARKSGRGWLVRCPAHDDHTPSLSLVDGEGGKLLVKCWAGCTAYDVLASLRQQGLLRGSGITAHKHHRKAHCDMSGFAIRNASRTAIALHLWQASQPAINTPVAIYLHERGIILPSLLTLRYHTALKHSRDGHWPAMVALVQRGDNGQPIGIHRTFLARDGKGKAPISPNKMMLGPCCAGAVRLAPAENLLMIGEGIETCLAAMQATNIPAWAALSTSGLRALDLPSGVREVIILADGDDPGEQAAQTAARRWQHEGRSVKIARPPRGMDFNDLLQDAA